MPLVCIIVVWPIDIAAYFFMVFNCFLFEDMCGSLEVILVSKNDMYCELVIIDKIAGLSSCLHFICFWIGIKVITLYHPARLLASDKNIKSITGFVGSGRSAQTDYEILKPYAVTLEVQLKNPDEFSYVYSSHCTIDNAMQEIQISREAQLVCNIPLALVANILTSTQANKVAKEHNVY